VVPRAAPEYNCTGGARWDRGLGRCLGHLLSDENRAQRSLAIEWEKSEKEEFFAAFSEAISALILRHSVDLVRKRREQAAPPNTPPHRFVTEQSADIPKARRVDGTPEYSFHKLELWPYGLKQAGAEWKEIIELLRDLSMDPMFVTTKGVMPFDARNVRSDATWYVNLFASRGRRGDPRLP
jgi:hypothetical protein